MEALRLFSALVVLALAGVAAAGDSPPASADLPFRCPRNDSNLAQCTGEGFVRIINSMTKGKPEWSVPVLDPLLLPPMPVNKDAGDVLNINMTFIKMQIREIARNVVLKSVEFDPDKMDLTMILSRPNVHFVGRYKIAGKVLWLPIWGSGRVRMRMLKGVNEIFKMRGERREDEAGRAYWHLAEYSSSLSPGLLRVNFDNLFNGNRLLGYGANSLLNAEWKRIYGQLHPITDAFFSGIMRPHWADIMKHLPLDEVFPAT